MMLLGDNSKLNKKVTMCETNEKISNFTDSSHYYFRSIGLVFKNDV